MIGSAEPLSKGRRLIQGAIPNQGPGGVAAALLSVVHGQQQFLDSDRAAAVAAVWAGLSLLVRFVGSHHETTLQRRFESQR